MTTVKTLSLLSISALMTGAMSLGALAQPAPVGQDRAAVQAETRRAAAAGTLQPRARRRIRSVDQPPRASQCTRPPLIIGTVRRRGTAHGMP